MNALDEQKKSEMRDNILSLAMSCPVEHCNPEDCPLFKVRKLELTRRLEWFRQLSDEDLVYLNAYHFTCMKARLTAHLAEICH
jgi:hypothetical protein